MPVVQNLELLLVQCAPIRHRVLRLEARQSKAARSVLASKDRVGLAGPVHVALVRHVKYRPLCMRVRVCAGSARRETEVVRKG